MLFQILATSRYFDYISMEFISHFTHSSEFKWRNHYLLYYEIKFSELLARTIHIQAFT